MNEAPAPQDGVRVLVDRLWPRGLSKEKAGVNHWMKDSAPSADLRKWFDSDPDRWLGLRRPLDCERMRKVLRRWRPYGGLVCLHLLLKYL